jgi:hypothetical protein
MGILRVHTNTPAAMKHFLLLLLLFAAQLCVAQNSRPDSIATAAHAFLRSLDAAQRAKVVYPFADAERFNWHFVPKSRNGVPMKALRPAQKEAALTLLRATLSRQGYDKAIAIMQLETVLKELEKRGSDDDYRDPGKYFITVFGEPGGAVPWGWRLEGHHLALNFASATGRLVSATPTFMGSNPGVVPSGSEKGKRILVQEVDMAFGLLKSLTAAQRQKAVLSATAPAEILTGNSRNAMIDKPEGIPFNELTKDQQRQLMQLVGTFVRNYHNGFANDLMRKIEQAGLDKLRFAWAGAEAWGGGHYYRIHGPVLLIEYDNTQNDGNHIHTVVRDLTNDFGDDALKNHHLREHSR